ncbi:class I SAM-dependent methyltransferase [Paraclostridium sordellii]|uniref:Methyltransferase type 11 n=1 Tax=Paraclostridium sordellii TaxID=1505 RepID=A0A0C7G3Z0_PARSO|nr:class I SAM-dependent methyltransferase [Paeniclostridium sordellii]CEN77600.1 methyltransferase type 11 [[Clostridium] sordellii] [Paeniclostridium sordellii]CEQ02687.1 methyltransferase type 11 [[Clostridium] sordellii] [Paeniclostridium sordellii]
MNLLESKIKKYYEGYDEDNRLIKDNSHSIEFITTTKYLDKYISKESKILEVGAATGRYSFYYAKKGCEVTALELSENHIEIMKNKQKENELKLDIIQGNALDLSKLKNEYYDFVLLLGPMYHLTTKEDRTKCVEEALRVLKPGGIITVAYINRFAHFVDMVNRDKEEIKSKELQNILKNGVEFENQSNYFYFSTYNEIENLMQENDIIKINHIATDGIADMMRGRINSFAKEEFNLWLKYHLENCENPNLIGYSKHSLYIGRK